MVEVRSRLFLQAIALSLATACGGSNGTSGVVTGLPSEQKLSTLSDAEVQQACRSLDEGSQVVIPNSSFFRVACLATGVQAGFTETSSGLSLDTGKCQSALDACVKELTTQSEGDVDVKVAGVDDNEEDCSDARSADVAGCEATVGEYETCYNLVLNALQRKMSEFTCQNAETVYSSTYDRSFHPEEIPQCQALMEKCPDAELGIPFGGETAVAAAAKL
ncbi:MAG TPA: hypothetical protein VFN67_30690 [Polyangiales bacterium]|nr:hypothetical protein [Polyangiales bacterium]